MTESPPIPSPKLLVGSQQQFSEWSTLNDTIMGGQSQGSCRITSEGLVFYGELIEERGGFVSCRSNMFTPPLDLSKYKGLQLEVNGEGRTLKIAVSCKLNTLPIFKSMSVGLKWVAPISTKNNGATVCRIPFQSFEPSLRAKRVYFPVKFNPFSITQFQILHSKFGRPGRINKDFQPGKFEILVRSIYAYS